jgi:hypothetical protein
VVDGGSLICDSGKGELEREFRANLEFWGLVALVGYAGVGAVCKCEKRPEMVGRGFEG